TESAHAAGPGSRIALAPAVFSRAFALASDLLEPDRHMTELIDAALDAASRLPSPPAFRVWCLAYRAGHTEAEAMKRAFGAGGWGLTKGRVADFTPVPAHAETRLTVLKRDQIAGWAQAAAVRAVLELVWAERHQSAEAAHEQRTRAADLAAAALRF